MAATRLRLPGLVRLLLLLALGVVPVAGSAAPMVPSLSTPGPYAVGWVISTVDAVPPRTFQAVLYYPAAGAGGMNAAIEPNGAPYPAIAFGHGYLQPVTYYESTLKHLASWGFLVIAPRSGAELFPNHSRFADDLSTALTHLEIENDKQGSFLHQLVDTAHFGIAGHSMGGGASLLAAANDARIVAISTLAAAETRPSAIQATANITRPLQLVAGSEDKIVPPGLSQTPMYVNAHAPRQAPLVQGGFHCGFEDQEYPIGCDQGSISRETQLALTRSTLTAWFLLYLRGETGRWIDVWGPQARANSQVIFTGDDGIALEPRSQAGFVAATGRITYTVSLTNTAILTTSYALAVESNWAAGTTSAQTEPVAPGAGLKVDVWVVPPASGVVPPASSQLTLTVRSLLDGGTTSWANVTTSLVDPATPTPTVTATSTPTVTATPMGSGTPEPPPDSYRFYLPFAQR